MSHDEDEMISPLGVAKYLEDKLKAANVKHCDTCLCAARDLRVLADIDQTYSVGVQTTIKGNDPNLSLCLRCNANMNSPSTTSSPFLINLIKSSESIVSDAKSNFSCNDSTEKLFGGKRDELTVNPILGHNSVCDRLKKGTTKKFSVEKVRNGIGNGDSIKSAATKVDDRPKDRTSVVPATHNPRPITGSSISSSSLTSASAANLSVDGSKIFESFNRNLIKSIKVRIIVSSLENSFVEFIYSLFSLQAEKPNISGPRLCALRIANGSTNILLDNIESNESNPVVYTRRSRFLDEELDETKDVITTHEFSSPTEIDEKSTQQKISMLMSDGVKTDTMKPINVIEPNSVEKINCNGIIVDDAKSIRSPTKANGIDRSIESNDVTTTKATQMYLRGSQENVELQQQDECAILRRQQLSRVAEWVQNNSQIESIAEFGDANDILSSPSPDYKYNLNHVGDDFGGCLVDRTHKSLTTISQINNNMLSNGESGESLDAENVRNYFAHSNSQLNSINNNHVDLAQMEYNVKQFLLKQNEWSGTGTPSRYQSSSNGVTGGRSTDSLSQPSTSNDRMINRTPHRTETNL